MTILFTRCGTTPIKLVRSHLQARFPLGDFFRAKRLFSLSASLITSANAMPTKEKVASREKSRLVENGLKLGGISVKQIISHMNVTNVLGLGRMFWDWDERSA